MYNPICKKYHIHLGEKSRDWCNDTGYSVSLIGLLLKKPRPWRD
jgi:hypothetical protein